MSKLKENIDRILGNSIRCLLPSYWWKRIFGLIVDEVEKVDKQGKNKQDILVSGKNIKTINNTSLLDGGNIDLGQDKQLSLFLPAYGSDITLSEEEKESNRQVHVACRWPNEKERVGINAFVISSVGKYIPVAVSMIGINRGGWLNVDVNWIGNVYEYSWQYAVNSEGEISGVQQYFLADDALSTTSLRPVQNKVVTESIRSKQGKLESGINIKTINGESILGGGNLVVATKAELTTKQDTLVSGTNIKTVNGQSILGEGDITIQADVDTSAFATKEELNALQTEVINNEEVTAAAINDLNTRIGAAADTAYVDNAIASAITSTLNTEV